MLLFPLYVHQIRIVCLFLAQVDKAIRHIKAGVLWQVLSLDLLDESAGESVVILRSVYSLEKSLLIR